MGKIWEDLKNLMCLNVYKVKEKFNNTDQYEIELL